MRNMRMHMHIQDSKPVQASRAALIVALAVTRVGADGSPNAGADNAVQCMHAHTHRLNLAFSGHAWPPSARSRVARRDARGSGGERLARSRLATTGSASRLSPPRRR